MQKRNINKCLYLGVVLLSTSLSKAQTSSFTNFQPAKLVIGQLGFTNDDINVTQQTLSTSSGGEVSSQGVLAVANWGDNRVLLWNTVPTSNGAPASVVVGQTNFTNNVSGTNAFELSEPNDVAFSPAGNKMIVCDSINNRVLIWNTIPTTNGAPANVVIGQVDLSENINGLSSTNLDYPADAIVTAGGKLIIADLFNNRVLIYNSIPTTNNAQANVVVGQPTFTDNFTGNGAAETDQPTSVTVSPDGKLLVSDANNNRVLIFNTIPTTNGAAANAVIGQDGFGNSGFGVSATNLNFPWGVAVSSNGRLAVSDLGNSRVLIYDAIPTVNGAAANVVLGQPNFSSNVYFFPNGTPTAQSIGGNYIPWFDNQGNLFVSSDYRVMLFQPFITSGPTNNVVNTNVLTGVKFDKLVPKDGKKLSFKVAKGFKAKGRVITTSGTASTNTFSADVYAFFKSGEGTNVNQTTPVKLIQKPKIPKKLANKGVLIIFKSDKTTRVGVNATPVDKDKPVSVVFFVSNNSGAYYQTNNLTAKNIK